MYTFKHDYCFVASFEASSTTEVIQFSNLYHALVDTPLSSTYCCTMTHTQGGGLDMVYAHVTLITFLTLHSMIAREHANVDRVYRDARSRTKGAERSASLSWHLFLHAPIYRGSLSDDC